MPNSRSADPAKSARRRSPEPFVVRSAAFVRPMPKPGSSNCSCGSTRRGVKPASWSSRQKSLRGFAKWAAAAAETRPGLIPQKTQARPGARTSGTELGVLATRPTAWHDAASTSRCRPTSSEAARPGDGPRATGGRRCAAQRPAGAGHAASIPRSSRRSLEEHAQVLAATSWSSNRPGRETHLAHLLGLCGPRSTGRSTPPRTATSASMAATQDLDRTDSVHAWP